MKKLIVALFVIILIVGVVFAINDISKNNDSDDTSAITTSANESLAETNKIEETTEHKQCGSLYHNKSIQDCLFFSFAADDAVSLLEHLHTTEYGSAGSSFKLACSGMSFIDLAYLGEENWDKIPEHLDKLTDVQLDYLSFRIKETYDCAVILSTDNDYFVNAYNGFAVDWEPYANRDITKLVHLFNYMSQLFEERGVKYEWMTNQVCPEFTLCNYFHDAKRHSNAV